MLPLLLLGMKDYVVNMLESKKSMFRFNDPVVKFLKIDHIGEGRFKNHLRILPLEIVEKIGAEVLHYEELYLKYYKDEYDYFHNLWTNHYKAYQDDRIQLYEMYMHGKCNDSTPLETYNKLNDLMIKIERRSLVLAPAWKMVVQKHKRQSGDEKEYEFARAYWVNDKGQKQRIVNRLVGQKFERLEKEIGLLYHNLGFAVHRWFRLKSGKTLDMVIERNGQKTAIEIKQINPEIFTELFVFDELLRRFNEDYPNG